jgi:hypothetical protein
VEAAAGVRVEKTKTTATNRYDRRDPRVSVASDEPTMERHKGRSNRRINSAPQ